MIAEVSNENHTFISIFVLLYLSWELVKMNTKTDHKLIELAAKTVGYKEFKHEDMRWWMGGASMSKKKIVFGGIEEYFCSADIIGKTIEVVSLVVGGAVYGKNRKIVNADCGQTRFIYKGVITDVFREGENGAIRVEYLTDDGMYLCFYPQNIGEDVDVIIY